MNKSEQRAAANAIAHYNYGNIDSAARALSALYRSSLRNKAQLEILEIAKVYGLLSHPDFIV